MNQVLGDSLRKSGSQTAGFFDHVHLLVHYPPKVALSRLVNSLKGVSSRLLREPRPEITGRYHKVSCGRPPVSPPAAAVRLSPLSLITSNHSPGRSGASARR